MASFAITSVISIVIELVITFDFEQIIVIATRADQIIINITSKLWSEY